MIFVLQRVKL